MYSIVDERIHVNFRMVHNRFQDVDLFDGYPILNYDIVDIVSNGEDVFYLSEKTESEIIRKTVDCETNGIWKIDAENYTVTKVSDKCSYENILATKNYVYCYKIEYVFPRGVANSWAKGFSIEQIAI